MQSTAAQAALWKEKSRLRQQKLREKAKASQCQVVISDVTRDIPRDVGQEQERTGTGEDRTGEDRVILRGSPGPLCQFQTRRVTASIDATQSGGLTGTVEDHASASCESCLSRASAEEGFCPVCGYFRGESDQGFLDGLAGRYRPFTRKPPDKWKLAVAELDSMGIAQVSRQELLESGRAAGKALVEIGHPIYVDEIVPFWYTQYTAGRTFLAEVLGAEAKFREWSRDTISFVNSAVARLRGEALGPPPAEPTGTPARNVNFWPWHLANIALAVLGGLLSAAPIADGNLSLVPAAILFVSLWRLWETRSKYRAEEEAIRDGVSNEARRREAIGRLLEEPLLEGVLLAFLVEQGHRDALKEDVRRQKWKEFGERPEQIEKAAKRKAEQLEKWREQSRRQLHTDFSSNPKKARVSQAYNFRRAEQLCADWLTSVGVAGARLTVGGADGGVDIESFDYVAQVKNSRGATGVKPVRELYGVAMASNKRPLFFSAGGYTKSAEDFARSVGMPLLIFDGVLGSFRGANMEGRFLAGT